MKLLYTLLFLLISNFIFAIEIENLIDGKEGKNFYEKKLFQNGGKVEIIHIKNNQVYRVEKSIDNNQQPLLVPEDSSKKIVLDKVKKNNPDEFVELLYIMKRPNINKLSLSQFLTSKLINMNSMVGILYFSGHMGKMMQYIKRCFIVEKVKSFKKVKSLPNFSQLDEKPIHFIIMQEDNRFSPTWYNVVFEKTEEGGIRLQISNLTTMYAKFLFFRFKALDANKLRHNIIINPVINDNEKIYVYAISEIHNTVKKFLVLS